MKEPQPGTCFAFPTPELAKYSSSSSPCYSRKHHRSSWPFGRTGLGSEPHPQHGLPWRGEDKPRGGGPPSPRSPQPCSPPRPLEMGRTSHAEGGRPPAIPSALLPSEASRGSSGDGEEEREAALTPISSALLPSCPLSSPCSPRWQERTWSLETRPLEGEHRCFSLNLSLPESRFQNATGTGATRKSQV